MKNRYISSRNSFRGFLAVSMIGAAAGVFPASAAPTPFADGVTIGGSVNLLPFTNSSKTSLGLSANTGGLYLYSDESESARGIADGGITLWGQPVHVVLANGSVADGKFSIWDYSGYDNPTTGKALFEVDSAADKATFENVGVEIKNGSLTVSGDVYASTNQKLATEAYVSTAVGGYLAGNSLQLATGTLSLSPTGAIAGAYGTAQADYAVGFSGGHGNGQYSFGVSGGTANGFGSAAFTGGQTAEPASYAFAAALFSLASGYSSVALSGGQSNGEFSTAFSEGKSFGIKTIAGGKGIIAFDAYSVAFGNHNLNDGGDAANWVESGDLFTIGNGTSPFTRSNAITTLKNGHTTLTNKAWKAIQSTAGNELVDPPATTTDSDGKALTVEGHTELKGKVTITIPQGDISMGIYE